VALTTANGYSEEYEDRFFATNPFLDPRALESQEEPLRESPVGEAFAGQWELETPFYRTDAAETGTIGPAAPEIAALAEIATELKDSLFREALEQLAEEALEAHADQLAGEYGDRETRDTAAERLLNEHFEPLAAQAEAMLDRFFERLEGYEAGALTEMEIDRIAGEILPTGMPLSPASEQFLGGWLRKAGNLVKKAVKGAADLAGKGLAAVGKLALGPLLRPLRKLGRFLLGHVAKYALDKLPAPVQPYARKLADKLFQALGETQQGEFEEREQTEAEAIPAVPDVARLEAEFDLQAAQLLLTPDETEIDHLVSSYGEGEAAVPAPLAELDNARAQLVRDFARLQQGESAQPALEQFLPAAILPAKAAIAIVGRPRIVSFVADLLGRLIKPLIGAEGTRLLAPAIADTGLRVFGLETSQPDPRAVATEALAATVEETINSLAELPRSAFENETLLEAAVLEAFETAAAANFPNTMIKPELRETAEEHGIWIRFPRNSHRKRYAKYMSRSPLSITITPRVARALITFGGATLDDHLRDQLDMPNGRPLKANVILYKVLPGATASRIARAEGFPAAELHPLTPQAAGVLLGPNAELGGRHTPLRYLDSRQALHVNQRLYRIEPAHGRHHHHRHHHHRRHRRAELLINLPAGEIRVWLYLSEPLCQSVSTALTKGPNATAGFIQIKPLVERLARMLKAAMLEPVMPSGLRTIGDTPQSERNVPPWLATVGRQLGAKLTQWASEQVALYLSNKADEFRSLCASRHDGVTLRITMTRVPGMESLRLLAQGKPPPGLSGGDWLNGTPAFEIVAFAGREIK
jgi:hypothetical protein